MAVLIAEKTFWAYSTPSFLKEAESFYRESVKHGGKCYARITLYDTDGKAKKSAITARFERLLSGKTENWEHGEYNFFFVLPSPRFFWKSKEIYLTAREVLYLFQRLVLKEGGRNDYYTLRNLRKKLGKGFLADLYSIMYGQPLYTDLLNEKTF